MSYELVDEVLESWCSAHQLQVSTEYKGEPVRSIQIVGARRSKIQIWVDPASPAGIVSVYVWDYHRQMISPIGHKWSNGDDLFRPFGHGWSHRASGRRVLRVPTGTSCC